MARTRAPSLPAKLWALPACGGHSWSWLRVIHSHSFFARRPGRRVVAGPPSRPNGYPGAPAKVPVGIAPFGPKVALLRGVVDNYRARQTIDAKSSRHARNSVTRQNFLFLNLHRKGWLTRRSSEPTAIGVTAAKKPSLSRCFTEFPCELPAVIPLGGRAACHRARWGFDGPTRGVGLAFVRLRGYGRRCWLVL